MKTLKNTYEAINPISRNICLENGINYIAAPQGIIIKRVFFVPSFWDQYPQIEITELDTTILLNDKDI